MVDYINDKELAKKRLEIIDNYKDLINCDLDESLIPVIIELKNECKLINEVEYDTLFNLVLADIYINSYRLDEALKIMLKNHDELSKDNFNYLHIMILERIIYVYIIKQYYQTALHYAEEKKKYFLNQSNEIINRWYLEMAYIHEALGEKNRSLLELKAILNNNPDDQMKLLALSNITKLYIDEGDINNALTNLSECFTLSFKLDDHKSNKYCEFLRAKIFRLQKDYNKALTIFNNIFTEINDLDDDNFNYLNEYITLLKESNSLQEAKKISEKYLDLVEANDDLISKKEFYENYLQIRCSLVAKNKNSLDWIFTKIKELEKQITLNNDNNIDDIKNNESIDSSIIFDDAHSLLDDLNNVKSDTLRNYLMDISKITEKYCGVNEILYVIYSKNDINIIPTYSKDSDVIKSYSYKVNRLYERDLSYDDLSNTILELMMTESDNISFDFTHATTELIDPITKNSYSDIQIKYLFAKRYEENNEMFGSVIFLSRNNDITDKKNRFYLEYISKYVEKQLLNIFKNENLQTQKGLLNSALNGVDINIFYQNVKTNKMFLPAKISEMINHINSEISFSDYETLINPSDKLKYQEKIIAINNKQDYKITYHLNINGKIIPILEQASIYNENNNYYYGTICNTDVTKSLTDFVDLDAINTKEEFLNDIEFIKNNEDVNNEFDIICLKVSFKEYYNDLNLNNINIIKDISENIKAVFNEKIYLLDDIFVIKTKYKSSVKLIKEVIKKINKLYSFDNKFIKPIIKEMSISYPKDINNLDDLPLFINYIFNKSDVLTSHKFNELYFNDYLNYETNNNCVISALKDNSISLIYNKINYNNALFGYLVIPNIKGLTDYNLTNNIDEKIKTTLEEEIFYKVINSNIKNIFMNINIKTLKNLLNTYFDKNPENNSNISFIIDEFTEYENETIKKINKLGFNVYINGNNIKNISIEVLIENCISGIYNIKEEDYQYINLFNKNLDIITYDMNFIDYKKCFKKLLIITDEIIIL